MTKLHYHPFVLQNPLVIHAAVSLSEYLLEKLEILITTALCHLKARILPVGGLRDKISGFAKFIIESHEGRVPFYKKA